MTTSRIPAFDITCATSCDRPFIHQWADDHLSCSARAVVREDRHPSRRFCCVRVDSHLVRPNDNVTDWANSSWNMVSELRDHLLNCSLFMRACADNEGGRRTESRHVLKPNILAIECLRAYRVRIDYSLSAAAQFVNAISCCPWLRILLMCKQKFSATISDVAVALAGVLYALFVRTRRGHLGHLCRCIDRHEMRKKHHHWWQAIPEEESLVDDGR